MSKYLCFIVCHGNLADEIYRVTQNFLESIPPVYTYSNQILKAEAIETDIIGRINHHHPEFILIFVDLFGGSCWQSAMRIKKQFDQTAVISGVNLPVMASFAHNYERMEFADLIRKLTEDGKKGIQLVV